jgi:imidazolonepropionase-like amidohydrolase
MTRVKLGVGACLFFFCSGQAQPPAGGVFAITGASVFGPGGEILMGTVVVRGDRIESVGAEVPKGARIVRAAGHTLLPGFFDVHTHLPYAGVSRLSADWAKNLAAYLYCGVTTVVDFGTYPETFEPMRRLTRTGIVESPRLVLAARLTTPGGHGAEGGRGEVFSLEVSTPREARAAMKRLIPYKPDVIKVFTDGWRYGTAPDMTSMEEDTLVAIVDEAHRQQMEVLTHTVTLAKSKIAARAGVDVIAHGIGDAVADSELIRLMKEQGTTYAPTLAVYESRQFSKLPPLLLDVLEPAARERIPLRNSRPVAGPRARRWEILNLNTAALRAAGVRFATGTDAGVTGTYHGWSTLQELKLLAGGGLTPVEALLAATENSARALHLDKERGAIGPGMLADLVLVEGKPYQNIAEVDQVRRVWVGGREIDREKLARMIGSAEMIPLPTAELDPLIDDMEQDERTSLGTLRVYRTDLDHDHSKAMFTRVSRSSGNSSLMILASMSEKERPFVRIDLPLTKGAVTPADVTRFTGIQFDVRGAGGYKVILDCRSVRDDADFQAPFEAESSWKTVQIPFTALKQRATPRPEKWTGKDVRMVTFEIARQAGTRTWLDLDNVRFYR